MLASRTLRILAMSFALVPPPVAPTYAQTAPPAVSPKLLLKGGLRLTHLLYLPNGRAWQLILPASLGAEYRFKPQFSLYAQAEADISASRAARRRRGATSLPTPVTSASVGARYYFHQPAAEAWGHYLALETSAELAQVELRDRGRRGGGPTRLTPGVFVFCGSQHGGPTRRLLYDLNAGLGMQAPPPYAAEPALKRPWDATAQVNLRVYLVNHHRTPKPAAAR